MNMLSMLARIPSLGALALLRFYRTAVSPQLPPACRYVPTCSEYSQEAFEAHGFWRALALTARRLSRCHPFGAWGFDPVPPAAPARPFRGLSRN